MAYQSWNGSGFDLYVYDADQPSNPPLRVYSGDFSRIVSWSPDAQWLLCVMQSERDLQNGLYSLVAFPVMEGATPQVLLSRADIDWGVWGANGKIYYWNGVTGERRRLDPPEEWSTFNPWSFQDRPTIIYLIDQTGLHVRWFHVSPEEEVSFDYHNPGQVGNIQSVYDVFPYGRRFLASIPTYCGITAVVNGRGRIISRLWSHGCDEPPFVGVAVTSDGRFVVGLSEREVDDWLVSSTIYLADASATWRVRIEDAPQGWAPALSRTGYSLAYETIAGDSIYVGDLQFAGGGP